MMARLRRLGRDVATAQRALASAARYEDPAAAACGEIGRVADATAWWRYGTPLADGQTAWAAVTGRRRPYDREAR